MHTKNAVAYVGAITELANTLLENRGESNLSPRAVGEILRQELGLVAQRKTPGYELSLDRNTQQRVHRLAFAYNVLQPVGDCPLCAEVSASIPAENQSVPGA